jgi:hypothetical protein
MITLPHRRQAEPPTPPRRCDSGAMFEVVEYAADGETAERTLTCATCFPLLLTAIRALGREAVHREVEPAEGLRCECLREVRR